MPSLRRSRAMATTRHSHAPRATTRPRVARAGGRTVHQSSARAEDPPRSPTNGAVENHALIRIEPTLTRHHTYRVQPRLVAALSTATARMLSTVTRPTRATTARISTLVHATTSPVTAARLPSTSSARPTLQVANTALGVAIATPDHDALWAGARPVQNGEPRRSARCCRGSCATRAVGWRGGH